ncbi:MAG: hypothetical protein Ta2A_15650 [Treponemataceae bacterium]|nr:MAG: hypothetical protein Ta2A_15650 [Treponemataceae bacterium]
MKTTKSGRKFCAILPRSAFALVLLALCAAFTFTACENQVYKEFVGYPKLTVTAPQFTEVVAGGYTSIPRQIVILNVGKRPGGIKSVTVSPDMAFTIGVGSKAVDAYENIADWTVQPKPGLEAGTHRAIITVTYRGAGVDSAKATASVEFVVAAAPPAAPSRFVALGNNSNKVAYSADGINWRESTLPSSARWYAVTYGKGRYVAIAGGQLYDASEAAYSSDGINWTAATLPGGDKYWCSVAYGGADVFVAVARYTTTAAYSYDGGSSWEQTTMPVDTGWQCVTYGNGKFVALATGGRNAAYSYDGITWSAAAQLPVSQSWFSVTYGGGKYVAVAENTSNAVYSTDGINWTAMTLPANDWMSVTYGNGKFVAVSWANNRIAYSSDGITWSQTTVSGTARSWWGEAYGNGRFVVVAHNYCASSTTGSSGWTQGTIPSGNWQSVAYGTVLW